MTPTIRIKTESTDENPQGFIVINLADFNSDAHQLFDDEDHVLLTAAVASGQLVPSAPDLLAARDQLIQREAELSQRIAELDARDADLRAQVAAQAEAQALLESAGQTEKLGIADLRAALTAKGVAFDPAAKKAELQALLDDGRVA